MTAVLPLLIMATSVGAGAVGGVFFAFSGFVMPALRQLPPAQAAAAMRAVNVAAVRPPLMSLLFGTGALALAASVAAGRREAQADPLLVAAGSTYLIGVLGTTVFANVPLNNALARTTSDHLDGDDWRAWSRTWTRWNHVRTVASLAATIGYTVALHRTAAA